MAEHIEHMKDGIYEKVMSKEFADKLMEAIEAKKVWAERDDADAYEATGYLSSYLEKLIRLCLKDIADRNTEAVLSDEIELTNQLVEMLAERLPDLGHGHSVVKNQFLLKSLEHVANKTSPRKWESPDTSLTKSFLFTNSHNDTSMVSELRKEIMSADRIDFLVSFIRFSGLALLLPYLRDFTNKGGHLRVITTIYMGATDPKAVVELAKLPNTEIHISYNVKETRLHAKSYIFHRDSQFSTAYIGSSNLSHAAIAEGLEWNMKITEQDMPSIMEKMTATFETYWNSDEFQEFHVEQKDELIKAIDHERGRDGSGKNQVVYQFDIKPYPYQQAILDALEAERKQKNHWKNLVVAATGTGKTAISAFDYRNFMGSRLPQTTRLLFVAHREEILKQSQACFRQVLKNADFGELAVGGNRATSAEHLFISVQTFNSQKLWERMDADYYDMIIVDEFHHAAADSYQKLLSHFKPKILLGLTATPERMDGKSILTYFDNRMAAEIRLSDAIERRLLCPFHYFGVQDTTNLENVKWTSGDYDIKELTDLYTTSYGADKRAYAIMNAIEQYSADLRDVKGIGFCVSQKHAAFMADYMNKHDLPSIALDANSKKEDRDGAKRKLETGDIKFIFTVDIFNEGVDIPAVNTVLFLRPTNSMTVFIQQLGRGLRLDRGKDCLTVLDFVAQANKKYNFAGRFTALLGKKDVSIKKEIEGGFPHVPKGCAIQLEKVAQERILDNIKKQLSRYDFYKELVLELRETLGKVPTAAEFFEASKVEPHVFYNDKRTYARLCADAGIIPNFETTEEETFLQKAVPRMLSIDSTDWISFLLSLFDNDQEERYLTPLQKKYLRMWQWTIWGKDHEDAGMEAPLDAVHRLSKVTYIKEEIISLLTMQRESVEIVPQKVSVPYICPLDVYANYTRDQIFAALGFKKPNSIREGVKFLNMTNTDSVTTDTDVFLVTLNKSEKEFSDTTLYEDYSISKTLFHWQSQSTTSDHSKTGQRYIQQNKKGNIVFLFVRKSKKDAYGKSMPYTFLGTAHFVNYEGSQPMSIIYRLDHPIPAKYIRTTDTAGVL